MRDDKTLQDVVDAERAMTTKETSDTIKKIHDNIKNSLVNSVIPEMVFIEYFLDFFKYPAKHADSPLLSKWIELSGGPYNEVDVVNAEGKIIYTVPGAYMPPVANFEILSNYNFANIASNYQMKKKITSAQATNYISTILSTIPDLLRPNVEMYINRWASIFARYDVTKTTDAPKPKLPKVPVASSIDTSILGI